MFRYCRLLVLCSFVLACSSPESKLETTEKIQVTSPALELKNSPSPSPLPQGEREMVSPPQAAGNHQIEIKPLPLEETAPPQPVPFEPKVIQAGMAVAMLIDASGSMNGLLGTETKFNLSLSLLEELAPQWGGLQEPPIHFGVRLFGSQASLEENNCEDSQLLFSPETIDPAKLRKSLEGITARGKSPIAHALRKAAEDLSGANEDRVILLLADGKDNCGQDPCAVARELYTGPAKIVTHVIAFDITQEDEAALKCIADAGKGVFLLARTREELASAMDEALGSTIPYNLRVKTLVGGTPLPTTITVSKTGAEKIAQEKSYGIELFRLPAGSYDFLIEYTDSIETQKPSKILKGVALTQTGKVEQEIRFALSPITLSARDAQGKPTMVDYFFYTAGTEKKIATVSSDGEEKTYFLAPGQYDLVAKAKAQTGQEMILSEPKIQISAAQGFSKQFAFQTGTLILKGVTSNKTPIPFHYKVTKVGEPAAVLLEGQAETSGGKLDLPPGSYDIYIEGTDPLLSVQPQGELKNVALEGGSILEKAVVMAVGTLKLKAVKPDKKTANTSFKILAKEDGREVAVLSAPAGEGSIGLKPGIYQIIATLVDPIYTAGPQVEASEVKIEEGKTTDQTLTFPLGTLKLLGRNAKEQRLQTEFTIYKSATEEVVAKAGPNVDWFVFDLGPGNYDVKGVQTNAKTEPKPTVWLRDIAVEAGFLYVREAVFTNAKLRLIGRGANNEVVAVGFKLYEYGHDRPLISGVTGQDWQIFDLVPGSYYIEAKYLDENTDQTLKKWITLKVGENEFVEKELRF